MPGEQPKSFDLALPFGSNAQVSEKPRICSQKRLPVLMLLAGSGLCSPAGVRLGLSPCSGRLTGELLRSMLSKDVVEWAAGVSGSS